MNLRYLSVCSGIEAATCAWHPLGWQPFAFSQFDPDHNYKYGPDFPSAVLAHHYGSNLPGEAWSRNGVPNFGDMTKFEEWPDAAIDLLVGGTPCQDFSIAGLRAGMDGMRGSLTLVYAALARKYRPRWLVWENVPGVLSSNGGRDFASLLGLLSGRRIEIPASGWQTAGIVLGIESAYGLAWRVLDAQYVRVDGFARAVPQRRRRVFVVGYLGDWRRAAAVLFEREGLSGNPAPRREAGKRVAPTINARTQGGGGLGTDFDCAAGLIASHDVAQPLLAKSNSSHRADAESYVGLFSSTGDVSHCLNAGGMGRQDYETETLIATAHALRAEGFDASEDGTGRGVPTVPIAFDARQSDTIIYGDKAGPLDTDAFSQAIAFDTTQITSQTNRSVPKAGEPCHPLASAAHPPAIAFQTRGSNLDLSGDHSGTLGSNADRASGSAPTIAFSCKDHGADAANDVAPTLRAMGFTESHANAGGQLAVAFDMRGREGGSQFEGPHETANIRAASGGSSKSYIAQQWAVRRLIPVECERLQGFKDNYTLIRTKMRRRLEADELTHLRSLSHEQLAQLFGVDPETFTGCSDADLSRLAADGPRYKALGNSMAVNVMRWLGQRIGYVDQIEIGEAA